MLHGTIYRSALTLQSAFYCLGLLSIWPAAQKRSRLVSTAGALLLLNAAALVAPMAWFLGRANWTKVEYVPDHQCATQR
jgi:hypothetical protein